MVDYATLEDIRQYGDYGVDDTGDDSQIITLIPIASLMLERWTGRRWGVSSDETHYFGIADVCGRDLNLYQKKHPLLSITTLTNGDTAATTIASSEYFLLPRGLTRYHTIRLKDASTVSWTFDTDGYVSVAGKWGWSTSTPVDINQACIQLVLYMLRRNDSIGTDADKMAVSDEGALLLPPTLPKELRNTIQWYRNKV